MYVLARGDRKWPLNDGPIPNCRGLRVHASTGNNRVEGNRRASRNGRVSDLPPDLPTVTIRNFLVVEGGGGVLPHARHAAGCPRVETGV
jgi:hypothetical protein